MESLCNSCQWLGQEFDHLKDHGEEGAVWHDCRYPIPDWSRPQAIRKEFITNCRTHNAFVCLKEN